MITRVEALNYRCLQYICQPLERFHVLVGPNASGKTTFLDIIGFLSDFVSNGLASALERRSPTFEHVLFGRTGDRFELAIEFDVPEVLKSRTAFHSNDLICRYELVVAADRSTDEVAVEQESARFITSKRKDRGLNLQRSLFPDINKAPETLALPSGRGNRMGLSKSRNGSTNYYAESYKDAGKGWVVNLKLGSQKSALANLPEDEDKFPVLTWVKHLMAEGVQPLMLDGKTLRSASPPNQPRQFMTDASNLPWVVSDFRKLHPQRFRDWVLHLREALPDLADIDTFEQDWDRYRYLILEYSDGLKVPSWTASDGTLRLIALTLPAFLPDMQGVFLIEEPENGIHPKAVETLHQAISNVYGAQVLVATHSPVLLGLVKPEQILCFAKNQEGATDIVRGDEHPAIAEWRDSIDLQDYFVSGILG